MKVKSLRNVLNKDECFPNSYFDSQYGLIVGKEYLVISISVKQVSAMPNPQVYFIVYDQERRTVIGAPSILFEIIDFNIPTTWTVLDHVDDNILSLGPKVLDINQYVLEDFHDGLDEAKKIVAECVRLSE